MVTTFNCKIRADRPYEFSSKLSKQFESDRNRIITSAAIRRLQQKTQVFPLERNAAVRSRLTHSLEVQQAGRYICQLICEQLDEQSIVGEYELMLESIVEMACLMHDIGNPPFGHFGEAALSDWLGQHIAGIYKKLSGKAMSPDVLRDLTHFEGNAQGIRLVHTLLNLNLTYSQASGIMKYTRCGAETPPEESDTLNYLKKKVGFYLSEQEYIGKLRHALDIAPGCRSPFSYIMEAADDISYGMADLEDAVEKNILSYQQLKTALKDTYRALSGSLPASEQTLMADIIKKATERTEKIAGNHSQFFIFLRVQINQKLPQHAARQFIDNFDAVMRGQFNQALIEDGSDCHLLIKTFKEVARELAFAHPEVEGRELQGYRVISGLLSVYEPLLQLGKNQFATLMDIEIPATTYVSRIPIYSARLFKKLPEKHKQAYRSALNSDTMNAIMPDPQEQEFYLRVRLIIDYISGMTDQFAFDEYRAFQVIDEI
ncbi:dGTPase [Pseudoalteromonas rubra]|uniref:Deoxyguanosinetriphosphate triphosphohydrolase n=1 Tax=Pseudoalteromonas rubra TaxID=43658 RepID=A0A0U3GMM8_9GAMM|nr:dGTPase [Pseudoalteromonas rubra]ALU41470.1 deoxyguanosinetriphosphate triphosphohydrolase [Pseudoalteromonas rubra]